MKKRVLFVVLIVSIIFSLIFFIVSVFMKTESHHQSFAYSDKVLTNPLVGYAPSALEKSVSDDISLVYVDVTWKELEPSKGVYDWESIEKENQFDRWRKEGKHVVFRFVLDLPSKEVHQDLPEWLTQEMADPGDRYDSSYGKGFSPNYSDPTLISYYQKAVAAMAQRWAKDELISYIQLGVVGHWGEWHINQEAGTIRSLPTQDVLDQYVSPWVEAFPDKDILMRRPFALAKKYQLGIYNDMAGNAPSTKTWLKWIQSGGVYDQTGETDAIVAMPDAWKKSPIGGEFTSANSMQTLLERDLDQTVDLIRESHTSFLGPKIAQDVNDNKNGYQTVLKNMGYRLWISDANLRFEGKEKTRLSMVWKNSGVAPLYRNWQAYVYVKNWAGQVVEKVPLDLKLANLEPDQSQEVAVTLTTKGVFDAIKNQYSVSVGVVDPMTQTDALHFAVEGQEEAKQLVLFE
ncbi:DUF4832 domain-containing protein [Streptococcus oricebi]|uniref:DUF4832 domain-containing protein n=1 Tax=Streptococcus oricebi TaxID=1547447 RepID=A0ABS5B4G3_9STRE|nr:DUF4832 domain-containing protein [Streptococcus oricebi]MBP2623645.1 DUF4832 domain-containing protein [Streptococcus oricebi]